MLNSSGILDWRQDLKVWIQGFRGIQGLDSWIRGFKGFKGFKGLDSWIQRIQRIHNIGLMEFRGEERLFNKKIGCTDG